MFRNQSGNFFPVIFRDMQNQASAKLANDINPKAPPIAPPIILRLLDAADEIVVEGVGDDTSFSSGGALSVRFPPSSGACSDD
jgi:hypothetical protein